VKKFFAAFEHPTDFHVNAARNKLLFRVPGRQALMSALAQKQTYAAHNGKEPTSGRENSPR